MFKKIEVLILVLMICLSAIYFTSCESDYSSDTTADTSIQERSIWDEESFTSPDGEKTLVVRIYGRFFEADSPQPCYAFYWQDGSGVSEMLASCETKRDDFDIEIEWNSKEACIKAGVSKENTYEVSVPYPDNEKHTQTVSFEINNDSRPQIKGVEVTGECTGNIENKVSVEDAYKLNAYVSDTVGLVGVPVSLEYSEDVTNVSLTFIYDEQQIAPVPQKNLMVLYNNSTGMAIDELPYTKDFDVDKITVPNAKPGIYLLDDAYVWRKTWGKSTAGYEYEADKSQYVSNWERDNDADDIMAIADIEWAKENAPEFHVSTPEQLAGVVYYVNVLAERSNYIYLENDIDLNGINWLPMGERDGSRYSPVIIEGNGHTIHNMSIIAPDKNEVGFIAYGDDLEVYNLKFQNAYVEGKNYVGILCGVQYTSEAIENVHVQGEIVTNGDEYGALIGSDSKDIYIKCTSNVRVNGKHYPYLSPCDKETSEDNSEEIYEISVDDYYNITRTENDEYSEDICWKVYVNGKEVLQRGAEKEIVFDTKCIDVTKPVPGSKYKIYLEVYPNHRVSNVIEYQVPVDYDVNDTGYTYTKDEALEILKSNVSGDFSFSDTHASDGPVCHYFWSSNEGVYLVDVYTGECYKREGHKKLKPV